MEITKLFQCPQCLEEYEIIKGDLKYCPDCRVYVIEEELVLS